MSTNSSLILIVIWLTFSKVARNHAFAFEVSTLQPRGSSHEFRHRHCPHRGYQQASAILAAPLFSSLHDYPTAAGTTTTTTTGTPQLHTERVKSVVSDFVHALHDSVTDETFQSLTLRGVKRKKGSDIAEYRGAIRQIQGRLIAMPKTSEPAIQLTCKYHGATDIAKNFPPDDISQIIADIILDPSILASEWGAEAVVSNPIQGGELQTNANVYDMQLSTNKPKLKQTKNKKSNTTTSQTTQPLSHDRKKNVPLPPDATFFNALGVTHPDGKPRAGMKKKLKQCQKFVEIVGNLVPNAPAAAVSVMDMGCGRGYLTFALHSYLCERFPKVHSRGIDVRPKLMLEVSKIAKELGGAFDSLSFDVGTIEDFVATATEGMESTVFDVVIALHACDTATDDALWSGVLRRSDLIVVAPCCHKEVRSQLDQHYQTTKADHAMGDVLRHGIYRERISETVTDSLRALLLEWAGYKVQVFEFIGGEHTSKNVMITAVKDKPSAMSTDGKAEIQSRIHALAGMYGIRRHKLAELMGFEMHPWLAVDGKPAVRDARYMPPI